MTTNALLDGLGIDYNSRVGIGLTLNTLLAEEASLDEFGTVMWTLDADMRRDMVRLLTLLRGDIA